MYKDKPVRSSRSVKYERRKLFDDRFIQKVAKNKMIDSCNMNDLNELKKMLSPTGLIKSRKLTGIQQKYHKLLSREIKRLRKMGII